ncbi:hypothetical protein HCU40_21010 (plasmid) [Pseudanabaena biceps]|nr:hypothetical protein [Pseudanabaena biceps]
MSTRAIIGKQIDDDFYLSVYLHRDGYVDYAGVLLQTHYATTEQVDQLLALGNRGEMSNRTENYAKAEILIMQAV